MKNKKTLVTSIIGVLLTLLAIPMTSCTGLNNESNKKSISDIDNFVVDLTNVKALGIANKRASAKHNNRFLAAKDTKTENVWVKTSHVTLSNEVEIQDGVIEVNFKQVKTTNSLDKVTTTQDLYLNAADFDLDVIEKTNTSFTVPYCEGREYKVLAGGNVILDWTKGNLSGENTVVNLKEPSENYSIKTRNTKGNLSFQTLGENTYSLYHGEDLLFDKLTDNCDLDTNKDIGVITVANVAEEENYKLIETGFEYSETVTQEDIDGKIDKLLVNDDYTFISFVPANATYDVRPEEMYFPDNDGLYGYDKCNYFTSNDRVSFVVYNKTGKIYKIENFHIDNIYNGLIFAENDGLIYDMTINEMGELEFNSLFSNPNIHAGYGIKDKYGNKYICNESLNNYDSKTRTTFYKYGSMDYVLTEDHTAVKLVYDESDNVTNMKLINEDGTEADVTKNMSFKIINALTKDYEVRDGVLYGFSYLPFRDKDRFTYRYDVAKYDPTTNRSVSANIISNHCLCDVQLLRKYDILLLWDRKDSCLYSVEGLLRNFFEVVGEDYSQHLEDYWWLRGPGLKVNKVLENCTIDETEYKIIKHTLEYDAFYDFKVVNDENGNYKVDVFEYEKDTHTNKQIIFQPLN